MFANRFDRMVEPNDNVLKNNPQGNNTKSVLAH